jgi:hypothetical protein
MRVMLVAVLSHLAELGIFFGAAAILALGAIGLR